MAAIIQEIAKGENIIYPSTVSDAVYVDDNDKRLSTKLGEIDSSITALSENLTTFHYRKVDGVRQISDDGVNWDFFEQSPLVEFKKYDGLYSQSGLSVYNSRCTIVSGGYYVNDGWCYVKMTVKDLSSSLSDNVIVQGFPNLKYNNNSQYNGITMQDDALSLLPLAMVKSSGVTYLTTVFASYTGYSYNQNEYDVYIKYPTS